MNTPFDNSIILQDGNTLTILQDDKKIQTIIDENFKFNKTITKIEIKTNMKKLNLTCFLSVVKIECFGNTIDWLYIKYDQNLINLGPNSNYLTRY